MAGAWGAGEESARQGSQCGLRKSPPGLAEKNIPYLTTRGRREAPTGPGMARSKTSRGPETDKGQIRKGTPQTDEGREGIGDRHNLTHPGPGGKQRWALLPISPVPRALTVHVTAQHGFFQWVHTALLQPLLGWGCVQANEVLGREGNLYLSPLCSTLLPSPALPFGSLRHCVFRPCPPRCRVVGVHTLRKEVLGGLSKAPL